MNSLPGVRKILAHGMILVLAGLVWGLVVPSTPHPRLALGAHIQFMTNGMLFVVLATVLQAFPHHVGPGSLRVMLVSAWLTWAMGISEMANAWWGTLRMLPIAARQAGAGGGEPWQELIVTVTHAAAGVALILAWGLLIYGLLWRSTDTTSTD